MKTCTRCGTSFLDSETSLNCPECGAEFPGQTTAIFPFDGAAFRERLNLAAAGASVPPTVPPPGRSSSAAAPAAAWAEPVAEEPANDLAPSSEVSQPEVVHAEVVHAEVVEPEPTVFDVRPLEVPPPEVTLPPPKTAPPAPAVDQDDLSDEALAVIKASGRFTIGLLGYPASGKTWFLNRLKRRYELGLGRDCYLVDPPSVPDGSQVDSTVSIEQHSFTCIDRGAKAGEVPRAKAKSFYVVDIPGERFLNAAESGFRGESARGLIRTLSVCQALVIMLPAEQLLTPSAVAEGGPGPAPTGVEASARALETELQKLESEAELRRPARRLKKGPERDAALAREQELAGQIELLRGRIDGRRAGELDQAHRQLDLFVTGVVRLSAATSLLAKPKAPGEPPWTPAELLAMPLAEFQSLVEGLHGGDRLPPVYAALSKSDQVNSHFKAFLKRRGLVLDLDDFDADPHHIVRQVPADLHRVMTGAFPICRFDFLTAFAEHGEGLNINYRLNDYGVEAVIDWIDWTRRREHTPALLRWDAGLARQIKWLRDVSAPPPLIADGAVLGTPSAWVRARCWPGRVVARLVDSAFAGPAWSGAAWTAGGAALAAAVVAGLLGLAPIGLGSAAAVPAITPQMVYPVEIERMAEAAPTMNAGLVVQGLHAWAQAPSDGFLFTVPTTSPARASVDEALAAVQALESAQPVSASDADHVLSELKATDAALAGQDAKDPARWMIAYHEGLVDAWSGRAEDAQTQFKAVLTSIGDYRTKGDQFSKLSRPSRARLAAFEAATRYALGLGLLDAGDNAGAAGQLRQAAGGAGLWGAQGPIAPTSGPRASFGPLPPSLAAAMNTADLAADLVAADIRIDAGASASDTRAKAESELHAAAQAWSDAAQGASPELTADLVIAGLRTGDPSAAMRTAALSQSLPGDERDAIARLANVAALAFGQSPADATDIPWPDRAWAYTRAWRTLFEAHNVAELTSSLSAAATGSGAQPSDIDYLRRWQSQVARTAILAASGPARRDLVRAYAPLLAGPDRDVLNDARAPFGAVAGAGLAGIIVVLTGLGLAAYWRVRGAYWRLYGARHRADRLKAMGA